MALTNEDAIKVAAIIGSADGGCPPCVAMLVNMAQRDFPEHDWRTLVNEYHGYDLLAGEL